MLPLYKNIPFLKILNIHLLIQFHCSNFTTSLKIKHLDCRNLSRFQYNITGNGNNVYYTTSTNPSLNGLTYSLVSGGFLLPEGSSSINTIENDNFNLNISPNPFDDVLHITMNLVDKSDLSCLITDVTGKTVSQFDFKEQSSGRKNFTCNLSEKLPQGTYLLDVVVSNAKGLFRLSRKLIKN